MSICRKPRDGITYIHEERVWRDPGCRKVRCRTVLVGKVLRDTGEDWFYPEYHEGLVGIAKGKFHSIKKLREYRKKRPQGYKIWRLARLAKIAAVGSVKADGPTVAAEKSRTEHSDRERIMPAGRGDRSLRGSEMAKRLLLLFENLLDFVSYMSDINFKDPETKAKYAGTLWDELSKICSNKSQKS